ncbi:MAG TPA: putative baseplate assembly protein [Candidatus Limnocylindrales bacterium]|nr:putative baseplate assembly protein [Candidatus Limnocylindrales bacterium]
MALPVPNLDDRRFQDLVDDAKRLVQQKCPEWTDHNVSDPGVTLIELFAWMTDQLIYRLNRVPDRNYIKFLELIGVNLFPPTAARSQVTFWLSAPQPDVVRIPAGTQTATVRTETDEAIVFATTEDLPIIPSSLAELGSMVDGKSYRDQWAALEKGNGFTCFKDVPAPGDALYVGLSEAVPSNAVRLRFSCHIEGVGVDPTNPPLIWEAWSGEDWEPCELDSDTTGGLNRDGDVVIHVPRSHTASLVSKKRAGWVRARVTELVEGQPAYSASPSITSLNAITIGGTADAVNAELVLGEDVGISAGVPGERFSLQRGPVVPGDEPAILEVSTQEGWEEWTEVPDFAGSGPGDRHFVFELSNGELRLGPAVRMEDGAIRQFGAVPEKNARLRLRAYRTGGGRKGNVSAKALSVLKSSIPFVARVENRRAASGGVDGEDIENAKVRGPIRLRTRGRAVTTEDFEHLAREAAPEVARIRAVAAGDGADVGSVRVLVVPAAGATDGGYLRFEQLVPGEETLQAITDRLEEARVIGTRAIVEPPVYRGVTVVAKLRARPRQNPNRLQDEAIRALYAYFDPITGGPERTGWPFGRPVNVGEVYSVLQGLRGTEVVEDARLFGADPITGQRGQQTQRLEVEPHALVFSYEHQVLVEGA